MKRNLLPGITLVLVVIFLFPTTAHAYLDPGTGSILLQTLGVVFIAIAGTWAGFKKQIRSFFSKKKDQRDSKE